MKDNGRMTKPMAKVYITITMDQAIMVNGRKMSNKVKEYKNGTTDHRIKGTFIFIYRNHRQGLKHGYGKFIWPDLS